ncbi:MAG: DUF6152 family protein [Acidobacteriota bacterium]
MKNLVIVTIAFTLGLLLAPPASAHHSMAGFDRKTTVTLKGTVKQFSWQNPHCYIELEVPGKEGQAAVTWNVEMTAPGYLVRAGWKKTMVKPGDKVTVVGNPMTNGEAGALFVSVMLPDGQTMTAQGPQGAGVGAAKQAK